MRIRTMGAMVAALAGLGLAAACSDGAGSDTTTGAGTGSGGDDASTSSSGGGSAMSSTGSFMPQPDYKGPEPKNADTAMAIGQLTAQVRDLEDNLLEKDDLLVQICGTDLCLDFAMTNPGSANVDAMGQELIDPAFKLGGKGQFLFMGGLLQSGPDKDFGTVHAVRLGPEGGALEPGATVESAGVTLELAGDANVEQELLAPEGQFRAAIFEPSDGNFPALEVAPVEFDLIVGLGPELVDICPPAKLSFPNDMGWPDGAEVELYLNGVKTFDHWVPYGTWAKVAEAVVSEDGSTVTTKDGAGIPALGAYGVVLKP